MRWSWKIGRLAGINVYLHATFLLMIIFILFIYWMEGHSALLALRGLNDEALKGRWQGLRLSPLNPQWRVVYEVRKEQVTVVVVRISAHDYRT